MRIWFNFAWTKAFSQMFSSGQDKPERVWVCGLKSICSMFTKQVFFIALMSAVFLKLIKFTSASSLRENISKLSSVHPLMLLQQLAAVCCLHRYIFSFKMVLWAITPGFPEQLPCKVCGKKLKFEQLRGRHWTLTKLQKQSLFSVLFNELSSGSVFTQ